MLTGKDPSRSFLRGELSDAFLPVYPKKGFENASIKVWKLYYPPDIKTDLKYLKTDFPEIDNALQLQ